MERCAQRDGPPRSPPSLPRARSLELKREANVHSMLTHNVTFVPQTPLPPDRCWPPSSVGNPVCRSRNSQRLSDRRHRPTCDPAPAARALSGSLSERTCPQTWTCRWACRSRRGAAAARRFRSVDVGRPWKRAALRRPEDEIFRSSVVRALDMLLQQH